MVDGNKKSSKNQRSLSRNLKKTKPKKIKLLILGVVVMIIGLVISICVLGYNYINQALKPMNSKSNQEIEVKIDIGSTNRQIGDILQQKHIVRNGIIFDYYVRTKKFSSFKAGYYTFKPSMTLTEIAKELEQGGASASKNSGRVVIKEGMSVVQISNEISKTTHLTKTSFLNAVNDSSLLAKLQQKYPKLLNSAVNNPNIKYHLEGYLYPATYRVSKKESASQLIEEMVAKTNDILTPYYDEIAAKHFSVQDLLTLSSLVELEGKSQKDRRMIAGVFLNRLDKKMKLQTDISVLYSLGKHKEKVSYADLENNSPYNLYKNDGLGPGPFDNPSLESIKAVLDPLNRSENYLYFVADLKTGKVYYSKTYKQHQINVDKIN